MHNVLFNQKFFIFAAGLILFSAQAMDDGHSNPDLSDAITLKIFNGQDYRAGRSTVFNPNRYFNYQNNNRITPIQGADILPVVQDHLTKLSYVIMPRAIVEGGTSKENGSTPVYITPCQAPASDFEDAITMASRAEELRILSRTVFHPTAVRAAILITNCALPSRGLVHGGFGTMTYVAKFETTDALAVYQLFSGVESTLTPLNVKHMSDTIVGFDLISAQDLLHAIAAAQEASSPVEVPGARAKVASYVARKLALHMDTLRRVLAPTNGD